MRRQVLPAMQKHGPVVAWIVDDTGFPKQGKHSVGVARQYCGQIGKHDNCQAAVSLSVSTWSSSLPIAWRLYLPEVWCQDSERRQQAGVPEEIEFQTKPEIALEQIRQAIEQKVPVGVVLADAGYGNGTAFRTGRHGTRTAICDGRRVFDDGLGTGATTLAGTAAKTRPWGVTQTPAAQRRSSAGFGKAVGSRVACLGLEERRLAPGESGNVALSFRRGPRAPGSSRLQDGPSHTRKNGF